jgi:hypothetical protein
MAVSDFGSGMGATMGAQVRPDTVIVAARRFLTSPDIGYSVTRYRAPCVVVLGVEGSDPFAHPIVYSR